MMAPRAKSLLSERGIGTQPYAISPAKWPTDGQRMRQFFHFNSLFPWIRSRHRRKMPRQTRFVIIIDVIRSRLYTDYDRAKITCAERRNDSSVYHRC